MKINFVLLVISPLKLSQSAVYYSDFQFVIWNTLKSSKLSYHLLQILRFYSLQYLPFEEVSKKC